jgi:hypothetical protein
MRRLPILAVLFVLATFASGADQPPIPGLAVYKAKALSAGQVTCSKFVLQGVSSGTYYDGAWSMEKIAQQVIADGGDPAPWYACVDIANDVYRDAYVLPNHGSVPGYNEFTTGLRLHFNRTREAESRKGVAYMAGYHLIDLIGSGAAYCSLGDYNQGGWIRMRESSYCLRSMLDAQAIGIIVTPATKRDTVKNNLLSQLNQLLVAKTARAPASGPYIPAACLSKWYIQPFMAAIASHSLIQYYKETGLDKTNIYNMVKYVADWLWDNARVNGTQNVFWYQNCKVNPSDPAWLVAMPPGNPASTVDLSMFYPAIYQWLYMTPGSACGNTAYRNRADALFRTSTGTGMGFLTYDGKHFNQNYTFSREYVRLRSLPEPSCSTAGTPGSQSR